MALSCGFCLGEEPELYTSAQFSDAIQALVGDGITQYGARFALTVNGFTATAASGYALAAGRWLENDEPLSLPIQTAGNTKDRTDALVIRVDYEGRKAYLEILTDIDAAAILEDPSKLRGAGEYGILLYMIRVRRGVTSLSPEDVTDFRADGALCGTIVPLSAVSGNVLYVYQFLKSGIDAEVARLIALSNQIIKKAEQSIEELNSAIQQAGGTAEIGELLTARKAPEPSAEWLLCDGGAVPAEYPELSELLNGTLPKLSQLGDRYRTYIYAGINGKARRFL